MVRKVLLHVGTPKSGTSFVQHLLYTHPDELAARDVCYPTDRFDAHFLAALDLMQLPWGGLEQQAEGRWDALAAQARAWPGTAIISHEIFGRASRAHVARALGSFGDAEVHVVVSARDLVRQIPAEWQENLKHRRTLGYRDFLEALMDPGRTAEIAQWFWSVQEVPGVLDRWGANLPAGHVHVVTVPRPGAPEGLLWRRFAEVFGLDADAVSTTSERMNASLGVAEAALLRRVNEQVGNGVLVNADYRPVIREYLVHRNLSAAPGAARLTLPDDVWSWADGIARGWVEDLAGRGYDVVGDFDELLPAPAAAFADPDHPDEAAVAAAGVRGIAALAQEVARLRHEEERIHADNADLMRQIDALHATASYRAKQRLVRLAGTNPVGRAGLAGYRRVRGNSSRSA